MSDPGSSQWREQRLEQLFAFAEGARLPGGGFGWLDDDGRVDPAHDPELWINARMTYVFSLAALRGRPGAADLAAHGIAALDGMFRDREHGGWFAQVTPDGAPVVEEKQCYGHAFVVLASATAARAEVPQARALLDEALDVHHGRFWDDAVGACADACSRDWSDVDPYRGANANMHTVEAWLAAAAVTGDDAWLERAARIGSRLVDDVARAHDWRLVEHFTRDWEPDPEHHADEPAHPFQPYGATPGHAFEWARLLTELHAALDGPAWVPEAADALFDRAVADGVTSDPGIPYTTDWSGEPVVAERFHWVVCEATMAALALGREALAERWWGEIDRWFVTDDGRWNHELSPDMGPSTRTWAGRPDAYHAVNLLLS